MTDRLHQTTADYAYESKACYRCHPASDHPPYDHAGAGPRAADLGLQRTTYAQRWRFKHPSENTQNVTCCMCHDQKSPGVCKN